jgi:type II secretory pathway component GspD/PulD (secretin)
MKPIFRSCLLLLVLALSPLTAARAAPVNLGERIDLDVTDCDVRQLFHTVGQLTGARVELDPQFQPARRVSIRIDNVTIRTALTAICESIGCRWHFGEGAVVIGPMPPATEPRPVDFKEKITLRVQGANLREVVETMATIMGAELHFDETLDAAKLTLDLDQQTVGEALEAACAQAGCKWKLVTGGPKPILRVTAR